MRGASLPLVGALGAHLLRVQPMPPASWSLGLVGLGLLGALQGQSSAAAAGSEAPIIPAFAEPRQVELTGGIRLLLAPPDDSGTVAVCLGTVVGIAVNDPGKRASAVADLELRRENLVKSYREHFGEKGKSSRTLYVLNGDIAILCVSAAYDAWETAFAVALETIRPVTVTTSKWSSLVEQWRNHEGLAALVANDPLQQQLQALTWLGVPEATESIQNSIEQSSSIHADDVARASPPKSQRFVVTVAGQYTPRLVEPWLRANSLIRERVRSQKGRAPAPPALGSPQLRQNPRFAHERVPHSEGNRWLFSWPIFHLDEAHAASLDIVARLIERRLNRTSTLGKEGFVSCELRQGRGLGSLVIELRSPVLVDLDKIDKWVFSTIEQLRINPNNNDDLAQSIERVQKPEVPYPAIVRASATTQRSFLLKSAPTTPRPATLRLLGSDISRLVERDLNRRNVAEIFGEAQAPSPPAHANGRNVVRPQGKRTANSRGGRLYVVQSGESLQNIAHKFHVTITEIIRENGLRHPDQIRPGSRIVIPSPAATAK